MSSRIIHTTSLATRKSSHLNQAGTQALLIQSAKQSSDPAASPANPSNTIQSPKLSPATAASLTNPPYSPAPTLRTSPHYPPPHQPQPAIHSFHHNYTCWYTTTPTPPTTHPTPHSLTCPSGTGEKNETIFQAKILIFCLVKPFSQITKMNATDKKIRIIMMDETK